jgi:hypothetical protein
MNYQKIYHQLIIRAKKENRIKSEKIYYEAHHIIPRCLGGTGLTSQWKTHDNIVLLTAKEHFIAHLLLCEIYQTNVKLKYALWAMCNQDKTNTRYKTSSKSYERIKQEVAKLRSDQYKGRPAHNKGKPNPGASLFWKGRSRPELSERNRLRKGLPRKIKEGWVSPFKGVAQSQEVINKRAEGRKNNGKAILQFNQNNELIQEFRCITEARNWLINNNMKGDIRSNLYGKTKKAGGFIWKYKN